MPARLCRKVELHDVEIATRVGARVAEPVVLGDDRVDDGVALEALTDVEAGVRAATSVAVVELAVVGVERVDAVVAVAVGREVRASVAVRAGPVEAVAHEVPRRHVLHDDAVGVEDPDAVLLLEAAVEDHTVAVGAADREVRRGHVDRLAVHARDSTSTRSPRCDAQTAAWIVSWSRGTRIVSTWSAASLCPHAWSPEPSLPHATSVGPEDHRHDHPHRREPLPHPVVLPNGLVRKRASWSSRERPGKAGSG